MSHDKIGPRELALRKMREAKFGKQRLFDAPAEVKSVMEALKDKVAVAAKKTGKSMKRRKK